MLRFHVAGTYICLVNFLCTNSFPVLPLIWCGSSHAFNYQGWSSYQHQPSTRFRTSKKLPGKSEPQILFGVVGGFSQHYDLVSEHTNLSCVSRMPSCSISLWGNVNVTLGRQYFELLNFCRHWTTFSRNKSFKFINFFHTFSFSQVLARPNGYPAESKHFS